MVSNPMLPKKKRKYAHKAAVKAPHSAADGGLQLGSAPATLAALTGDGWRYQLELGYRFMLRSLGLSNTDFSTFPCKQRPSILSAGKEGASRNKISILFFKQQEEAFI